MHLHFDAPFSMLKKGLLGAFASRILIFKSPHLNFWVTQNVNEARFARKVEGDFYCDFQTS